MQGYQKIHHCSGIKFVSSIVTSDASISGRIRYCWPIQYNTSKLKLGIAFMRSSNGKHFIQYDSHKIRVTVFARKD